jgi:hypothetical protein
VALRHPSRSGDSSLELRRRPNAHGDSDASRLLEKVGRAGLQRSVEGKVVAGPALPPYLSPFLNTLPALAREIRRLDAAQVAAVDRADFNDFAFLDEERNLNDETSLELGRLLHVARGVTFDAVG